MHAPTDTCYRLNLHIIAVQGVTNPTILIYYFISTIAANLVGLGHTCHKHHISIAGHMGSIPLMHAEHSILHQAFDAKG